MLKTSILIVVIVVLLVVGYVQFFASSSTPPASQPITEILPPDLKAQDLAGESAATAPAPTPAPAAIIKLTFVSNGSTRLRLKAENPTDTEHMVSIPRGTPFESVSSLVVTLEPIEAEMVPGGSAELEVRAAALRPENAAGDAVYTRASGGVEQLQPIFEIIAADAQVPQPVVQLAILIVMENPPLSALAGFPTLEDDLPVQADFSEFSTDAPQLLAALALLKNAGVDIARYQVGASDQLRLETMVKPATRPMAQEVYGLKGEAEWDFWKSTLTEGDARLRHYALYGIGRFYPSIAVTMMPEWADNPRLLPAYRLAAVYSLGMSGSQDAYPVLEAMAARYPPGSTLAGAVSESLNYLRAVAPAP